MIYISMKIDISIITEMLDKNADLCNEIIKRNNSESRGIYNRFFEVVRNNKESDDNLGEEMLAICLHILSHLLVRQYNFTLSTNAPFCVMIINGLL